MSSADFTPDGIPTKRCPYCAELILEDAKKCKYCGEFLDPSLRGKYSGGPAHWEGEYLKVPFAGQIPSSHCVICCQAVPTTMLTRKFHYATLLTVMRETQKVDLPLCAGCRSGWRMSSFVFTLYAIFGFVGCPALFGWLGTLPGRGRTDLVGWGIFAGLIAWVWGMAAIHWLWVRRRQAICKRIDEWGAVLRLPNAEQLQTAWQEHRAS